MTAIVGFTDGKNIYIAGDSLGSNDCNKNEMQSPKVFKLKDFIFGYSGTFRFGEILQYEFIPPDHKEGLTDKAYLVTSFIPKLRETLERCKYVKSDEKEGNGLFILGYNSKLYKIQSDWSVLEPTCRYVSIGSGNEYCQGAMFILKDIDSIKPKDKVIKAIESASKHNPFVGGRIDVISLKKETNE